MKARVIVLALLLLLTACAQPSTTLDAEAINRSFYVATNGNDANPGTLDQTFRTIQKCATLATPGTACLIRSGTYRATA